VIDAVTLQRAGALESAQIAEFNAASFGGRNHCTVKVDQMAGGALAAGYTMRIVADTAGGAGFDDVPAMERKTIVGQNAGSAMAAVAQGISGGTFDSDIAHFISQSKDRIKRRAMRPVRTASAERTGVVGIVTIGAKNTFAGEVG
jgi:hypothetical protein